MLAAIRIGEFSFCSSLPMQFERHRSDRAGYRSATSSGVSMWATLLREVREILVIACLVGTVLAMSVGLAAALAAVVS